MIILLSLCSCLHKSSPIYPPTAPYCLMWRSGIQNRLRIRGLSDCPGSSIRGKDDSEALRKCQQAWMCFITAIWLHSQHSWASRLLKRSLYFNKSSIYGLRSPPHLSLWLYLYPHLPIRTCVCVCVCVKVCVHVFDRQLLRFYVWVTFQDDLDRTLHTLCWCVALALSDSSHPYSSSAHVGSQGIIRRVFHLT